MKSTPRTGELAAMRCVNGDEDLLVITNKGKVIRTPLAQVKIAGRNTQGVKIINLEKDDGGKVVSFALVPHSEAQESEEAFDEPEDINPALVSEDAEEAVEVVTPDQLD